MDAVFFENVSICAILYWEKKRNYFTAFFHENERKNPNCIPLTNFCSGYRFKTANRKPVIWRANSFPRRKPWRFRTVHQITFTCLLPITLTSIYKNSANRDVQRRILFRLLAKLPSPCYYFYIPYSGAPWSRPLRGAAGKTVIRRSGCICAKK